jgi:hypothetical protein
MGINVHPQVLTLSPPTLKTPHPLPPTLKTPHPQNPPHFTLHFCPRVCIRRCA